MSTIYKTNQNVLGPAKSVRKVAPRAPSSVETKAQGRLCPSGVTTMGKLERLLARNGIATPEGGAATAKAPTASSLARPEPAARRPPSAYTATSCAPGSVKPFDAPWGAQAALRNGRTSTVAAASSSLRTTRPVASATGAAVPSSLRTTRRVVPVAPPAGNVVGRPSPTNAAPLAAPTPRRVMAAPPTATSTPRRPTAIVGSTRRAGALRPTKAEIEVDTLVRTPSPLQTIGEQRAVDFTLPPGARAPTPPPHPTGLLPRSAPRVRTVSSATARALAPPDSPSSVSSEESLGPRPTSVVAEMGCIGGPPASSLRPSVAATEVRPYRNSRLEARDLAFGRLTAQSEIQPSAAQPHHLVSESELLSALGGLAEIPAATFPAVESAVGEVEDSRPLFKILAAVKAKDFDHAAHLFAVTELQAVPGYEALDPVDKDALLKGLRMEAWKVFDAKLASKVSNEDLKRGFRHSLTARAQSWSRGRRSPSPPRSTSPTRAPFHPTPDQRDRLRELKQGVMLLQLGYAPEDAIVMATAATRSASPETGAPVTLTLAEAQQDGRFSVARPTGTRRPRSPPTVPAPYREPPTKRPRPARRGTVTAAEGAWWSAGRTAPLHIQKRTAIIA